MEAKRVCALGEKHRINIKNKLGGIPTFFDQGGELDDVKANMESVIRLKID